MISLDYIPSSSQNSLHAKHSAPKSLKDKNNNAMKLTSKNLLCVSLVKYCVHTGLDLCRGFQVYRLHWHRPENRCTSQERKMWED